jgi:hypothetical protein
MPNVYYLNRKLFTTAERRLLEVATKAWTQCIRPQTIEFGVSDAGTEYAVVIDMDGEPKAHISFNSNGRAFVDSAWYGYSEFPDVHKLVVETMPNNVLPVYERMLGA